MRKVFHLLSLAALAALASCATPAADPQRGAPLAEAAARPEIFVTAANPLAAQAGMNVLRRGGSAVDAAAAVQAMLSLVEPQSSGIGGGAFMTYFDAAAGKVVVYDGRETAPAGATPDMFLSDNGEPLPFAEAVVSGRATGVPGVVRLLETAHKAHGRLAWRDLFVEAERTARDGFTVSPRLARMVNASFPQNKAADVRRYFTEADGTLVETGDTLRNPQYAAFLRRLSVEGADALYGGATARRIVERTRDGTLPGTLTLADLDAYRPVTREPLCGKFRVYFVCVPPPPSSGIALLQLLAILERTDIAARGPGDPQAWFLFAEASRLMYADRDRYVGDPAFVRVPTAGLLDPAYVAERARLIGTRAGPPPAAGSPPGAIGAARDATREPAGTTHFVIGDARGNVVSMTSTVESIFGSGRMVDGFFLNNQMTDFSFQPSNAAGRPAANAVAAGKRPRSSMTPAILLGPDRRFAGAIGSPGGNAILAYVGKATVGMIDWRLPVPEAIALPNLIARGANYAGEAAIFPAGVAEGLRARGIEVKPGQGEDSGLHGVLLRGGRLEGGADPRREGVFLVEVAPARR